MNLKEKMERQKKFFNSNATKDFGFRIAMLEKLEVEIKLRREDIFDALKKDLNKSRMESYLTEVAMVLDEINNMKKNLVKWSKPKKIISPLTHMPSKSYIYREPFGNVLIIAPWNYPFQLAMLPLVGAIAAGNTALIKPSRNSKYTFEIIKEIISEIYDEQYVAVVDIETNHDDIFKESYDLIFFTGSAATGKKIMEYASANLTPVILELGGKSPCIVDETANLKVAAKRIAWGKFLNSGQTCVCPDYVLVDNKVKDKFLVDLLVEIKKMYKNAMDNEDYPHIITDKKFQKLVGFIDENLNNEDKKVYGGKYNQVDLCIEPTVIANASWDDDIMKGEIFGPILPIIGYDDLDEQVDIIKSRPRSLAFYVFSNDKENVEELINSVSFGGGCVNDVIMHVDNDKLPFGGVGNSGMGHYHGKYSIDSFSRIKGVEKAVTWFDLPLKYPPYTERNYNIVRKILG